MIDLSSPRPHDTTPYVVVALAGDQPCHPPSSHPSLDRSIATTTMASRLVRAAHGASRVARLAAAAAARRDDEGASRVARSARAAATASPSSPSPLTTLIASPSATAPSPQMMESA
uniref:Uncharacterized protein n=1 Tax=Oryza meridionalis TaxID=40149 RepID=A0A0E0FEN2_9ORYZ